jgi:hypothetical protein
MFNNVMYIKKIIIYKNIENESNTNERTNGFDILKNKNRIESKLHKTKLCSHGKDCTRGYKCRFAHSKDELIVSNCVFGRSCKFIIKNGDGIDNISKTKICMHRHPNEELNDFYKRIDIEKNHIRKL